MAGINTKSSLSRVFSNALGTIVAVNVLVFIVAAAFQAFAKVSPAPFIGLLGPLSDWIRYPWGLLTYMFVQFDILHLFFNMIWLWGFGTLIVRFDGAGTLWRTYVAGGLGGGLCFLAVTSLTNGSGATSLLYGSSASVMAVIAGAATRQPRIRVGLMLFGQVELRVLALIAILLLGIVPGIGNVPSLVAHLGGALAGWGYVYFRFRRADSSVRISKKAKSTRGNISQVRTHQRRGLSEEQQRDMDVLLEKVRISGYKSLSDDEKKRLFNISSFIKE